VRPQREHLPGVRVGGTWLGVQVVAVVPDHDEAETGHGGEHRGPGASHHADLAAGHRQPSAVPLGRPEPRRQADVPPGAECAGQGGVDQAQVPCVRDHDERATARGGRGARGTRDLLRPVLARQRRPYGTRRPPVRQRREERRPCLVARPRARLRPRHRRRPGPAWRTHGPPRLQRAVRAGIRRARVTLRRRHCGRRLRDRCARRVPVARGARRARRYRLFRSGVPRRDGQPEHVRHGAGVPVGHLPSQRGDLRSEHRFRRDDPLQGCEASLVLADCGPVQQVTAHELPGEPDPDPAAGHRRLRQPFRHEVVEGPVEMRQRHIDQHPGYRQVRRRGLDGR
jgi:hypothetical protein